MMVTLTLNQKPLVSHFLEYPHLNPSLVTIRKTSKVCVLCVGDMKRETIQTCELILHILNYE